MSPSIKENDCFGRCDSGGTRSVTAVASRFTEALQPVLGLKLRKSDSLISLLSQTVVKRNRPENEPGTSGRAFGRSSTKRARTNPRALPSLEEEPDHQCYEPRAQDSDDGGKAGAGARLKACNFPATMLQIGNWQCTSQHVGDIVSKMYFAKRKIVWEVLEGGLKNKVEVQWSDISAIQARFYEDEAATLELVVRRAPLFFRETDPQPRKHTIWQSTKDFTMGEASQCKPHRLVVAPGVMNRHWKKLLDFDPRLNALSKCPPPRALTLLPPLALPADPPLVVPSIVVQLEVPKDESADKLLFSSEAEPVTGTGHVRVAHVQSQSMSWSAIL